MTHGSQALSHFPLGRSLHGSRHSCNRRYRGTGGEASSKGLGNVVALTPCPAADVKRTSSSLASPVLISPVVLSCQEVRYVKE